MRKPNPNTVPKMIALLVTYKMECSDLDFNAKRIAKKFKASNRYFYTAVHLGYFRKLHKSVMPYECLVDKFTEAHALSILDFVRKEKQALAQKRQSKPKSEPVSSPSVLLTEDACVSFLLKMGNYEIYKIERKQLTY